MSNILVPGFTAEGNTDVRFLKSIVQRTFEQVAFDCHSEIEVYELIYLPSGKSTFTEEMLKVAKNAFQRGVMVLCVHTDADADNDEEAFKTRIMPAFQIIETQQGNEICNNLVAVVPVQMTETWLIADTDLLKDELGTTKSDQELGLNRSPETIAKTKELVDEIIRIAFDDLPKRRRRPTLNELYLPLGQKISIEKLSRLPSFRKFEEGVRKAFHKLNYL